MIEVPEYIIWDGNTTNIENFEDYVHKHMWFSPTRGEPHIDHFYSLLDDGRIVRITNLHISRIDNMLMGDALYLGMGYAHHIKRKAK